ncbi:MAG: indole-3-glycerol phosphate synthase TrpC [Acidimicrobiales bacterium]
MGRTYLDDIVAAHRRVVDDRDWHSRLDGAPYAGPSFAGALRRDTVQVIAEVKRRSPSKGPLAPDLDPATLASAYLDGGAAAISVLTDEEFFGGSLDDLRAVRSAVDRPILRKDFTIAENDVLDARDVGAAAVLLIVSVLSDELLVRLIALASTCGLDSLVEVHDESESQRALAAGASIVGVNQRDLRSFEVDPERALRIGASLPPAIVTVAESGLASVADVERVAAGGFDAVLVGETFVRSGSPAALVAEFAAVRRSPRA